MKYVYLDSCFTSEATDDKVALEDVRQHLLEILAKPNWDTELEWTVEQEDFPADREEVAIHVKSKA